MPHIRLWPLMLIYAPLFLLGSAEGRAQTDSQKHAVAVLFEQFETVAYAGNISSLLRHSVLARADTADNLRLPFLEFIGAVTALGPSAAADLKRSLGSVLVGAKEFAPPAARIGAVRSRKCYISMLDDSTQSNVTHDFNGVSSEEIEGRRVWTWIVSPSEAESAPSTYYATEVKGPFLVLANDLEDLKEVAKALESAGSSEQELRTVVSWEALRMHQYWVCRSFRRTGATGPERSEPKSPQPDLNAMALFADPGKTEAYLRVFTSNTNTKAVPRVLPDSELNLLNPDGFGNWRATIHLTNDALGYRTLFQIFDALGFGAIL
jgi:hypothetical protein